MALEFVFIAGFIECGSAILAFADVFGVHHVFCRPVQFSRNSSVDDKSCLLVSSLPSLLYMMSSHRDICLYEC
jgi:hypothetical protein